ncbi:MAG: pyridoxamine 5'-phosphate oxidase family protein [Chitinophagaceae bacterium]|nr:pyridoxamine 5'-phosphate oxidase family protein [Rubrivivax sp.]
MNAPATRQDNPFHAGELAVQQRLGIAERMLEIGQRVVRTHLPEQHREFYAQLPFVMVGSVDGQQRPWASVLVGEQGFIQSPHERQLNFAARPVPGDPLAEGLKPGAPLGFLGIELHTRRRNRVNGQVRDVSDQGFSVDVAQTVGNCPQYIQGREMDWVRDSRDLQPRSREALSALDAPARQLISQADTLFIASHAPGAGADVSHRGGRSGFVHIEDDHTFLVPDFTGNFLFMTLGNLALDPRAGVLFIDFESGDLLTLTGRAEVVWDGELLKSIEAFEGAERAWRFHVESGWRLRAALPLRWRFREWSPNSLITGTWEEAAARLEAERLAQTWRPYRVTRLVDESRVIRSFRLQPADGHALPPFKAGQHLPIRLQPVEGQPPILRNYTISSAPGEDSLRLSIKRDGLASGHLHDRLSVGDVIEALGPRGQFTLDATAHRPAVLIGAGVGITPMISFLRHIVAEGFRHRRTRTTHVIQIAHDAEVRAFAAELQSLAGRANGAVRVHAVLSDGGAGASKGPLTIDLLKSLLPFDDHEFFLCGPGGFMQSLYDGLRDLGVRDERIQAEAFGPGALKRRIEGAAATEFTPAPAPAAKQATVVFTRSGEASVWSPEHGSLLEFAEGKGLSPPFSCRAGNCGTCLTRIQSGRVRYASPPAWRAGANEALLCCTVPAEGGGEHLELDL